MRYVAARYYAGAIFELWGQPEDRERQHRAMLPASLLGGFACELYLKAWLLSVGRRSGEVRAFQHNLRRLHAACIDTNFPSDAEIGELVGVIADDHLNHGYRYLEAGREIGSANWTLGIPILLKIDRIIEHRLANVAITE